MAEPANRRTPAIEASEWLIPLPPAMRLAFYGDARAQSQAIPAWGPAFSQDACRARTLGARATLWLGPDEYLLLDFGGSDRAAVPASSSPDSVRVLAELEHALSDVPHALVDISHRQFSLEVRGPHATTILSGACPLDLDLAEFPVDMCTRTVLAKAEIVLWRRQQDVFHLEIWRSFAGYVTGILSEIAAEFYPNR